MTSEIPTRYTTRALRSAVENGSITQKRGRYRLATRYSPRKSAGATQQVKKKAATSKMKTRRQAQSSLGSCFDNANKKRGQFAGGAGRRSPKRRLRSAGAGGGGFWETFNHKPAPHKATRLTLNPQHTRTANPKQSPHTANNNPHHTRLTLNLHLTRLTLNPHHTQRNLLRVRVK